MKNPDPTRNARAARYRAATREAGGAQINVRVGADAAAELASLRSTGLTVREAVERALALSAEAQIALARMTTARRAAHP